MTHQPVDTHLRDLLADLLEYSPGDSGDIDIRVLFARVLRLQAQVRALQQHHRSIHPACGHAGALSAPPNRLSRVLPGRSRPGASALPAGELAA